MSEHQDKVDRAIKWLIDRPWAQNVLWLIVGFALGGALV